MMRGDTGLASDISVGEDGSVWITCSAQYKETSGVQIMYYDFTTEKFIKAKGMGSEIAITGSGEPVMVLENGEMVLKRGSELTKLNGYARAISVS